MNGQMNMNYGNQYPNQGMMNQGMQQQQMMQQQAMMDPKAAEKKAKAKSRLKFLIIFVVIFLSLFFGKKYIDFITFDYKPVVNESLAKYYISSDSQDLKPIKDLLEEYKGNASIIKKIQNYSYEQVGQWFLYIDNKYQCDKKNANSCVAQLAEFKKLVSKLELLYQVKGGGYFIISPNGYSQLKAEGDKKVENLTAVANNRTYESPENSETIYQNKCKNATDCNCREGICSCQYTLKKADGTKQIQEIKCYKPETIEQR